MVVLADLRDLGSDGVLVGFLVGAGLAVLCSVKEIDGKHVLSDITLKTKCVLEICKHLYLKSWTDKMGIYASCILLVVWSLAF